MKRPNFNHATRSYFVLLFIVSAVIACTDKSGDTTIEAIKIDNVEILPKINCTNVEVPWLYINGDSLRALAGKKFDKNPLYFSTTIRNCTMQAAGWFLKKKGKDRQEFVDSFPQAMALPVAAGCGDMMQLPEGTFQSDFSIEKKQLKDIVKAQSKWIILAPELIKVGNNLFLRWQIFDTNDDPRRACHTAFQISDSLNSGTAAPAPAQLSDNLSGTLTPGTRFGSANPVPPYPVETAF